MNKSEQFSYYCNRYSCDHCNIDGTCMYGLNDDLIKHAKSDKPMCDYLKTWVLRKAKMFECEEVEEEEEQFSITDEEVGEIATYLENIEETIDLIREKLGITR